MRITAVITQKKKISDQNWFKKFHHDKYIKSSQELRIPNNDVWFWDYVRKLFQNVNKWKYNFTLCTQSIIKQYQLRWQRNWATLKSFKADVSSVGPLSERMTKGSKRSNVGFGTLYSGRFILSTRFIILNFPVILWRSTTVSWETFSLSWTYPLHKLIKSLIEDENTSNVR